MHPYCYKCQHVGVFPKDRSTFVQFGFYYRSSDKKYIRRYRCKLCKSTFSRSYFQPFFGQKKRQVNQEVSAFLSSTGSQRRAAEIFGLNRKTVVRKFREMSLFAKASFHDRNADHPKAQAIEFDDLETFEHTKCKPLSVTLAVEHKTRRILGLEVSSMPVSGLLVNRAQKYAPRKDERRSARRRLFENIGSLVSPHVEIRSDSNPHYPQDVKEFFPLSIHKRFRGKRGSLSGQGELKKVKFDPLFSLNHTCAKMRADINRLIRKTWCTTKSANELYWHLMLFADYHNKNLPPTPSTL